jgi:hypothetical protein
MLNALPPAPCSLCASSDVICRRCFLMEMLDGGAAGFLDAAKPYVPEPAVSETGRPLSSSSDETTSNSWSTESLSSVATAQQFTELSDPARPIIDLVLEGDLLSFLYQ